MRVWQRGPMSLPERLPRPLPPATRSNSTKSKSWSTPAGTTRRAVALLHRDEARFENPFHRALKRLLEIKKDVPLPAIGALCKTNPIPIPNTPRNSPNRSCPALHHPKPGPRPLPRRKPRPNRPPPRPRRPLRPPKTPSSTHVNRARSASEPSRKQPEPENNPSPSKRAG
jgi:hypothetical protein